MSGAKMLNKQVSLIQCASLCWIISCGLLALQNKNDIAVWGHSQDQLATRYMATIKAKNGMQMPYSTRLSIGGEKIELGEGATFTFTTNDQGMGSIPMSMEKSKADSEAILPFFIIHDMGSERLGWDGSTVVMTGLQPTAIYKMSAGLWLWAQSATWENPSLGEGPFKVFTGKNSAVVDCASVCVVGLSLPSLVSLKAGPLWRRAEVEVLSHTLAFSPMFLAFVGLLWRPFLRPLLRKGLVAVGVNTTLPMRVGVNQIR